MFGKLTRLRIGVVIVAALFSVFALVLGSMYMYPYGSVQIPASCKDTSRIGTNSTTFGDTIRTSFLLTESKTSISLRYIQPNYALPTVGRGVILTSDARYSVVVVVDFYNAQFNSTLYLIDKSDNAIITKMSFSNDFLAATMTGSVLYLYNSGLGYIINASNGESVSRIFTIDNYRDVSSTNGGIVIQTTAIIAGLYGNGGLLYQPELTFSGIAYGCLVPQP